jgi:uncharacterized protein YndB with AHSA1/START domain
VTPSVRAGAPARAVTVRRTFGRPREMLFEAWTDPDAVVTWFGGALAKVLSASVDLRVGGAYRLTIQADEQVGALEGTYREVDPPERLVYTWRWDWPGIQDRQSLVTVEFHERDGGTEIVITHEGLVTDEGLRFHEDGWTVSLERLAKVLQRPGRAGQ